MSGKTGGTALRGRLIGVQEEGAIEDTEAGGLYYVREAQVEIPLSEIAQLELRHQDGTASAILVGSLAAATVGIILFVDAMNDSFGGDGGLFGSP